MLKEFRFKNYKSFRNEACLSMKKTKIKELEHSILKQSFGKENKKLELLCSSVVYGPNASGKSNVIDALNTLKRIVLTGDIKNKEQIGRIENRGLNLELVPFIWGKNKPIEFEIEFNVDIFLFKYELSIDLGEFLDNSYNRRVLSEKLYINSEIIFERKENEIILLNKLKNYKNNFIDLNIDNLMKVYNETLIEDSLFLTNGFKTFSKDFSQFILNWFENDLIIVINLEKSKSAPIFEKQIYIDEFVNRIAQESGVSASAIAFEKRTNGIIATSLIKNKNKETINSIPVSIIESYGTQRIIQLMPIIYEVLKTGATLVVDELDIALHPMLMMNLIKIFHNDEVNKRKAQLIFNTHNPIYLNRNIFRRDEIKFVEKNFETHESVLYSLSDFGTNGDDGVRNTEDYMKNYFMNKYGAIVNIDYTDIFKDELEKFSNKVLNDEEKK